MLINCSGEVNGCNRGKCVSVRFSDLLLVCINCSGEDGGCNQEKKSNNLKSGFDFSFSIAFIVGKMQLKIRFFLYALHVCHVEQELNFDLILMEFYKVIFSL